MNDQATFLVAIRNNPDDDTGHLAYADFLEERNEAARAACIRKLVVDGIPFQLIADGIERLECSWNYWVANSIAILESNAVEWVKLTMVPSLVNLRPWPAVKFAFPESTKTLGQLTPSQH